MVNIHQTLQIESSKLFIRMLVLYTDNRKVILFCLHTSSDASLNLVRQHSNSNPFLNF